MIDGLDALFALTRAQTGVVGLRTRRGMWGVETSHEVSHASHTWFFEADVCDMSPWDPIVSALIVGDETTRRNAFLERDNAALDRAETSLRRDIALAWALVDASPAAVFVEDTQGRFLIANRVLEALVGLDREDLAGRDVDEIFPWLPPRRSESGAPWMAEVEATVPSSESRVMFCSMFPLLGLDGETHAFGTILMDVTARRDSERALKISEQNYREIFENAGDMIFVQDEVDLTIVAVNAEASKLGYSDHALIGRKLRDFSATDSALGVLELGDTDVTWPLRDASGELRWFELRTARISVSGRPHLATIARDVTQAKLEESRRITLEENLNRAQKFDTVGRLASSVAHEFNNLISVVLSHAELLAAELPPGESQADAEVVRDTAIQAAALARNLMNLGRRRVTVASVDVSRQVRQIAALVQHDLGAHVSFLPEYEEGLFVHLDPAQIDRIVVAMTHHSKHTIPRGGCVRLRTRKATSEEASSILVDHAVVIELHDLARGHSPEEFGQMFELFWNGLDLETQFGLALAQALVVGAGGMVTASGDEGRTKIQVILPAEDAATRREARTVLLADDDPTVLATLRRAMEYRGWRVLAARSGEEALEVYARAATAVDVVVTDVVMANLSGPRLAERLRSEQPNIHVVFMSGLREVSDTHLCAGAQVVHKPFATSYLLDAIERNFRGFL